MGTIYRNGKFYGSFKEDQEIPKEVQEVEALSVNGVKDTIYIYEKEPYYWDGESYVKLIEKQDIPKEVQEVEALPTLGIKDTLYIYEQEPYYWNGSSYIKLAVKQSIGGNKNQIIVSDGEGWENEAPVYTYEKVHYNYGGEGDPSKIKYSEIRMEMAHSDISPDYQFTISGKNLANDSTLDTTSKFETADAETYHLTLKDKANIYFGGMANLAVNEYSTLNIHGAHVDIDKGDNAPESNINGGSHHPHIIMHGGCAIQMDDAGTSSTGKAPRSRSLIISPPSILPVDSDGPTLSMHGSPIISMNEGAAMMLQDKAVINGVNNAVLHLTGNSQIAMEDNGLLRVGDNSIINMEREAVINMRDSDNRDTGFFPSIDMEGGVGLKLVSAWKENPEQSTCPLLYLHDTGFQMGRMAKRQYYKYQDRYMNSLMPLSSSHLGAAGERYVDTNRLRRNTDNNNFDPKQGSYIPYKYLMSKIPTTINNNNVNQTYNYIKENLGISDDNVFHNEYKISEISNAFFTSYKILDEESYNELKDVISTSIWNDKSPQLMLRFDKYVEGHNYVPPNYYSSRWWYSAWAHALIGPLLSFAKSTFGYNETTGAQYFFVSRIVTPQLEEAIKELKGQEYVDEHILCVMKERTWNYGYVSIPAQNTLDDNKATINNQIKTDNVANYSIGMNSLDNFSSLFENYAYTAVMEGSGTANVRNYCIGYFTYDYVKQKDYKTIFNKEVIDLYGIDALFIQTGSNTYLNQVGKVLEPYYKEKHEPITPYSTINVRNDVIMNIEPSVGGLVDMHITPMSGEKVEAFITGNTFLQTSGNAHIEAHDNSTIVMRGKMYSYSTSASEFPWKDGNKWEGWNRFVPSKGNGPLIGMYDQSIFQMNGYYECTDGIRTYPSDSGLSFKYTAQEGETLTDGILTQEVIDAFNRLLRTESYNYKQYVSDGDVSYLPSTEEDNVYTVTIKNFKYKHIGPEGWSRYANKVNNSSLLEVTENAEIRFHNSFTLKCDDNSILIGNGEKSIEFSFDELTALKNLLNS